MTEAYANQEAWRAMFTGKHPLLRKGRRLFSLLPGDPRCKLCLAPMKGLGAPVAQLVFHKKPSRYSPYYCDAAKASPKAIRAGARRLLAATGHGSAAGPWVEVGNHAGRCFLGTVGASDTFSEVTVLGDPVSLAARLASAAAGGEILVSETALAAGAIDGSGFPRRSLALKRIEAGGRRFAEGARAHGAPRPLTPSPDAAAATLRTRTGPHALVLSLRFWLIRR